MHKVPLKEITLHYKRLIMTQKLHNNNQFTTIQLCWPLIIA
jgi:hypothetical protein